MEQVGYALAGAIATYSAKSALFSAGYADQGTFFDSTGSFTITLTTTSLTAGWSAWFRTVSGTQTFDPTGAVTINGATTYAVSNPGDVVLVTFDGTNFVISQTQRPSTVAITGGSINGTTLGASTPSSASVTTLATSSTSAMAGALTITTAASGGLLLLRNDAPGANSGPSMSFKSDDGSTVMPSGGRLGNFSFQGRRDASNTSTSALVAAFATELWTTTAAGTQITFETIPNGSTTRATALTIGQDKSLTIAGTTASTSTTTGSLIVGGGIGVTGQITFDGGTGLSLRVTNGVANAAVATVMSGVGPTGAQTSIQGWLRISVAGTDRFIPFW